MPEVSTEVSSSLLLPTNQWRAATADPRQRQLFLSGGAVSTMHSTGQHASLVSALIWGLHFSTSTDHRVVGHHIGRWASPFQNKLTNPRNFYLAHVGTLFSNKHTTLLAFQSVYVHFNLGMRETRTRLSLGIFKEITLLLFFD